MPIARRVLPLLLVLLTTGCQTTGSAGSKAAGTSATHASIDRSYHLFFSPTDHVQELLASGDVDAASQVWSKQNLHFVGNEREAAVTATQALKAALSVRLAPRIERLRERVAAIVWPAPRASWADARSTMSEARTLKTELDDHRVLSAGEGRSAAHNDFLGALDAKSTAIGAGAAASFHADDEMFFTAYPVPLEPLAFLEETRDRWSAELASARPAAILAFRDRYEKALGEHSFAVLGRLYYEAFLASAPSKGVEAILAALAATRAEKLPLRGVVELRLVIADITARSSGERVFPVDIVGEAPFTAARMGLDTALDLNADLLLLVDVRSTRAKRRTIGREAVKSEYQSSIRHDDNPQFVIAKADLRQAESELRDLRRRIARREDRCGIGCAGLFVPFVEAQLEGNVDVARARLQATPPKVPVPSYKEYSFAKVSVDVVRTSVVGYYLIDRTARVLAEGVVNVEGSKRFVMADGLHDRDRNRISYGDLDKDDALVAYETAAMAVPASAVLADIPLSKTQRRPLPGIAEIRKEILSDRNTPMATVVRQKTGSSAAAPAAR